MDYLRLLRAKNFPIASLLQAFLFYVGKAKKITVAIDERLSFIDGLKEIASSVSIKISEAKKDSIAPYLPMIARNKQKNIPVLLLPYSLKYFIEVDEVNKTKRKVLLNTKKFDSFLYLSLNINTNFKEIVTYFYPLYVMFLFSLFLVFSVNIIIYVLLNISSIYLLLSLLLYVFISLIVIRKFLWFKCRNDALLNLSFTNSINDQELLKTVKQYSSNYFFTHTLWISSLLFLVSWLVFFGFAYEVIINLTVYLLLSLSVNYSIKKYFVSSYKQEQATLKLDTLLNAFRVSLSQVRSLKASKAIFKKIILAKEQVIYFTSKNSLAMFLFISNQIVLPIIFVAVLYAKTDSIIILINSLVVGSLINLSVKLFFTFKDDSKDLEFYSKKIKVIDKKHIKPVNITGHIELIAVWFSYPNNSNFIFSDYSLSIKSGSLNVICGDLGVGKTTLINLMMNNLTPKEGRIVIDGQDMRSLDRVELSKYFGLLSGEQKLSSGSIFSNIMSDRKILSSKLENLLLSHSIYDCLLDLPLGLATHIYWHKKNISLWEKTIINLAKAMIHDPKILFVDEIIFNLSAQDRILLLDYLYGLSITRVITSLDPKIDIKASQKIILN